MHLAHVKCNIHHARPLKGKFYFGTSHFWVRRRETKQTHKHGTPREKRTEFWFSVRIQCSALCSWNCVLCPFKSEIRWRCGDEGRKGAGSVTDFSCHSPVAYRGCLALCVESRATFEGTRFRWRIMCFLSDLVFSHRAFQGGRGPPPNLKLWPTQYSAVAFILDLHCNSSEQRK